MTKCPPEFALKRVATMEEWERGRAWRRSICDKITGGREMRRKEGDPEKDKILRALNNGERGMPFISTEELQKRCDARRTDSEDAPR